MQLENKILSDVTRTHEVREIFGGPEPPRKLA